LVSQFFGGGGLRLYIWEVARGLGRPILSKQIICNFIGRADVRNVSIPEMQFVMLLIARTYRTRLCREYKLCRLLLQPLHRRHKRADAVAGRSASLRRHGGPLTTEVWSSRCSSDDNDENDGGNDVYDDDYDDDTEDGWNGSPASRQADVTSDVTVTCVDETDERMTSLESKHQMSLQSMKEHLLSTVSVNL